MNPHSLTYAIAIEMDPENIKDHPEGRSFAMICEDIDSFFRGRGFSPRYGFVYLAETESINAVMCALLVHEFAKKHAWFAYAIKEIKLLRIGEMTDLQPAINSATTI